MDVAHWTRRLDGGCGNAVDFVLRGPGRTPVLGGTLPCLEPAAVVEVQEVDAPAARTWGIQVRAPRDMPYSLAVRFCCPAC